MSLLPKSEVHLWVGEQSVRAQRVEGWLSERVTHAVNVSVGGGQGVVAALTALAKAAPLPRRARMEIADSVVYYRMLAHSGPAKAVQIEAAQQFSKALASTDLQTSVSLMPDGVHWLACAVPAAWLQACLRAALDQRVRVTQVSTELSLELLRVQPAVTHAEGLLVLLREHACMLVRLHQHSPVAVAWERAGADTLDSYLTRIDAFNQRCLLEFSSATAAGPVIVFSPSAEASPMLTRCKQLGWAVLSIASPGVPPGASV